MLIIETEDHLREGVAHLIAVEPRFQEALTLGGPPPLRRREDGFEPLLKIIVEQQLSVASADAIWRRVAESGMTSPAAILGASDDDLRGCGLSRPKARYARALATATEAGEVCFDTLRTAPVDDAAKMLTAVTGIGQWTAEIYLMFCVGRADIFAPGDLALQEAAKILLDLDDRPDPKTLAALAEPWSPWRGVAARMLWAYYREAKGRAGKSGS